ncbi:hypothetical protein SFR_0914 [Streptomyces sp. FR-008]|nr:hypothetical protein SFR_0914 [Streptomyces sp. FR-008]
MARRLHPALEGSDFLSVPDHGPMALVGLGGT